MGDTVYNKSAQIISITIPKGGQQKILRVQSREFLQLGHKLMRHHDHMNKASSTELQRFCAMSGTSPDICSLLWDLLDLTTTMPNEVRAVHLLWGLMFLKLYASEAVHCAISGGVDEKTVCKWSWFFCFWTCRFSTSSCKCKCIYYKIQYSIFNPTFSSSP